MLAAVAAAWPIGHVARRMQGCGGVCDACGNRVGKEIFPEENFREIRGSNREIKAPGNMYYRPVGKIQLGQAACAVWRQLVSGGLALRSACRAEAAM